MANEDKADDYCITSDGDILLQASLFKRSDMVGSVANKTYDELCDMLDKHLPDERDGRETLLYTKKTKKRIKNNGTKKICRKTRLSIL